MIIEEKTGRNYLLLKFYSEKNVVRGVEGYLFSISETAPKKH